MHGNSPARASSHTALPHARLLHACIHALSHARTHARTHAPLRLGRLSDGGGTRGRRRDDLEERGLEGRATDEEAVDVGTLCELLGVVRLDGPAVDDAEVSGHLDAGRLGQEPAQLGVGLLRLLRRGRAPGADGPHRLVRDHQPRVVLGGKQLQHGLLSSLLLVVATVCVVVVVVVVVCMCV